MMASSIPRWVERWVGRPFDAADREPGCHCWGLVRRVLAEQRGLALPAYSETSAEDLVAVARDIRRGSRDNAPWRRIEPAESGPLDVVLMTALAAGGERAPIHCGILVTKLHVLHVERAAAAVVVPLDHWCVRNRVVGFFRHETLGVAA